MNYVLAYVKHAGQRRRLEQLIGGSCLLVTVDTEQGLLEQAKLRHPDIIVVYNPLSGTSILTARAVVEGRLSGPKDQWSFYGGPVVMIWAGHKKVDPGLVARRSERYDAAVRSMGIHGLLTMPQNPDDDEAFRQSLWGFVSKAVAV